MSIESYKDYSGVILCGGEGTRIKDISLIEQAPKPLLSVGGKRLVEYSTQLIEKKDINEIIFTLGCKADEIVEWVNSVKFPFNYKFNYQTRPGALSAITDGVYSSNKDNAIIFNSDEIRTNLNLDEAVKFHKESGVLATLITTYANNLERHRLVEIDSNYMVICTRKQPNEYKNKPNSIGLINVGIIILGKEAVEYGDYDHNIDWSGLLDPLCKNKKLNTYISKDTNYFNIGTPEEYFEAKKFLDEIQIRKRIIT